MKKFLLSFLFISIFLLSDAYFVSSNNKKIIQEDDKIRFIYISYLEYLTNFNGNNVKTNKATITKMLDNVKYYNFNAIFLHVSPFGDAIYKSSILPYSSTLTGVEGKNPGFDYLEFFIKESHKRGIKVHAWINPYRVSSDNNLNKLSDNNPIKKMDEGDLFIGDQGIYLNPSSENVKILILNQINELIENYEVDGIHLDDYFYIYQNIKDVNYDKVSNSYTKESFRLMHTNDLVKRIGRLKNKSKKNIIYSISPDGNINNNYKYHSADVKTWIKNNYIDIIMPQLYYGFENEYLPFEKAYDNWYKLTSESNVKLIPVLAFYKVGKTDTESGKGISEWVNNNVINKQIIFLKNRSEYAGFGLFRYDFLWTKSVINDKTKIELELLKTI